MRGATVVRQGMRRVQLAVFAALLAAVTLAQGAGSTAFLGRAFGPSTGAELRGGAGVSSALSTGGLRARLADRVGTAVRGARNVTGHVAPAAAAHADQAAASGTGGASGAAAALTRQPVPVGLAALVFAVVVVLLLALPTAGRGRPAGRAPPLPSGV